MDLKSTLILIVVAANLYCLQYVGLGFIADLALFACFCFLYAGMEELKKSQQTETVRRITPEEFDKIVKETSDAIVERKLN
jgi:hypothetical protein